LEIRPLKFYADEKMGSGDAFMYVQTSYVGLCGFGFDVMSRKKGGSGERENTVTERVRVFSRVFCLSGYVCSC